MSTTASASSDVAESAREGGSALVVTGGHSHPAEFSVSALEVVLTSFGLDLTVNEDPESAFTTLPQTEPDLLVVDALRFTMGHDRYAEHRDEWALSLSPEAREAVKAWVHDGGRLLALHTALVSFDDWPGWGDLIGGAWDWDRSSHPPVGEVEVLPVDDHPVGRALSPFEVTDECYVDLQLGDDNDLVAVASTDDGATTHPAAWVRTAGDGRVATSTLGHDLRSLDDLAHRALLAELAGWVLAGADRNRPTQPPTQRPGVTEAPDGDRSGVVAQAGETSGPARTEVRR